MLLTDEEIKTRVSSGNNLLNRLGLNINKKFIQPVNLPVVSPSRSGDVIDIPALPDKSELNSKTAEAQVVNHQARPKTQLTIDELIDDFETKVQIGNTQLKAINLLNQTLDEIKLRLPEIEKPDKLSAVAGRLHKIIYDNRRKPSEDEDTKIPRIVIHQPMMINVDQLNIVEISE